MIVVLPLVVLQLVVTVIFYNRHWDTVTRWLAAGVAGEVAIIVEELANYTTLDERAVLLDRFRQHAELAISLEPGGLLEEVIAATGAEQGSSQLSHIDAKILEPFGEKLSLPFAIDLRSEMPARVVVYVQLEHGLLRVLAPRKRLTSTTTQTLLFWMIGSSAVLITIAIYFLRLQIRPIRQLAKAVDSFGKGRDPGDFQPRGPAEIRQAAVAYNNMRGRLQRHIAQRTDMLAAISHDLRTPLTRMKLELEMLAQDDVAEGLRSDVDDMIELIETYLAFVRGQEGEVTENQPLAPILAEMRNRAERAGRSLTIEGDDTIALPLRQRAFKRCLANLIDNACRYGRRIRIACAQRARLVVLIVEDDGPGVPEDLYDKVIQPFFRGEQSRHRDTGGTGLGLAIARDVVLSHGGEMTLGRSILGGLKITMRMPA